MRMKFIAGNWKMYKAPGEAGKLAQELKSALGSVSQDVCVAVCPPFTALAEVSAAIKGSAIKLGAQNVYWEKEGAFTGEISAGMLKASGCSFVIIGHSERRKYFGETNSSVNQRIKATLAESLTPIVCVGETKQQREAGKTLEVVGDHIKGALSGFSESQVATLVIAYEPVWAIGTGINATPDQAQEVHKYIRGLVKELYSPGLAENLLILYGGSVKPDNIESLINQEDIDGALVGGASLKADSFTALVKRSAQNV